MWVVDASALYTVLVDAEAADDVRDHLVRDTEHVAPDLIDAEVLGVIRRQWLAGDVDDTAAALAVEDLTEWPGDRYPARALAARAWELRHAIRTWDAIYVALAESMDAPLLTLDERLARAAGGLCEIVVPTPP